MERVNFRECGDCVACCSGYLIGNSYGNKFGTGKPCAFLVKGDCSIYEDRPETCRTYQCAWTQGLFNEDMKPTLSNVMISVEYDGVKQYLKVMKLSNIISSDVEKQIDEFCKNNNTYWVSVEPVKIVPIKKV